MLFTSSNMLHICRHQNQEGGSLPLPSFYLFFEYFVSYSSLLLIFYGLAMLPFNLLLALLCRKKIFQCSFLLKKSLSKLSLKLTMPLTISSCISYDVITDSNLDWSFCNQIFFFWYTKLNSVITKSCILHKSMLLHFPKNFVFIYFKPHLQVSKNNFCLGKIHLYHNKIILSMQITVWNVNLFVVLKLTSVSWYHKNKIEFLFRNANDTLLTCVVVKIENCTRSTILLLEIKFCWKKILYSN
jgi:hypothetical protein